MLPRDMQLMFENRFSKQNIRKLMLKEIEESPIVLARVKICAKQITEWMNQEHYQSKQESLKQLEEINLEELIIDCLAQILPMGRSIELTQIVGQLAGFLPYDDYIESVKRMSELVVKFAEADLIDIVPAYASPTGTILVRNVLALDEKIVRYIEQAKFLPPMVCPPNIIKSNHDCGYLTFKKHLILKGYNQHNDDVCIDSINLLNQVPYSLDIELLKSIEEELTPGKGKKEITDLEKRKEDFDTLVLKTNDVCIDLIHAGNKFYFTHHPDARGRTYCRGYHCSYQGNSYRKAMLNFADTMPVDDFEDYAEYF